MVLALSLASPGLMALIALLSFGAIFGTFVHFGSFDESAATDVVLSQAQATSLALAANSTLPAGAITGALDVVLINTANAPGTQTTRTAAQLYQDLINALGFNPPTGFVFFLMIVHQGSGTLTLAGGTGVTLGTGTNSVATTGNRTYVVTVNSPTSMTIQTTGSGSA
jgi:hypothetical protein